MRCRNRMHIEDFTVGSVAAVEIVAIPRRHPDRGVISVFFRDINPAGNRVRLANAIHAAAFWYGLARLDHSRAGRHSVTWINPAAQLTRAVGQGETAQAENNKARALVVRPEATHFAKTPNRKAQHSPPASRRERLARGLVTVCSPLPLATQRRRAAVGCSSLAT